MHMCDCTASFWNTSFIDILTAGISLAALIAAIVIPVRIMNYQRYAGMHANYMSFEFAHALQSVISFYDEDCSGDVECIAGCYRDRYFQDMAELKNQSGQDSGKQNNRIELTDVLHYQRRYLTNYFYELEVCRRSSWVLRRQIRNDWTHNEAYVLKILVYMNQAVEENPDIFKDISSIKYEPMPHLKGLSLYLINLYNELKDVGSSIKA